MVLELVLLGSLTVTSYRSIPAQTDSTPFYTSIGEHTHPGGCAASRDLLGSSLKYGDYIYIEGLGLCKINDTTNARHRQLIDKWVENKAQEHAIGVRKNVKVYKVQMPSTKVAKR